MATGGDDTPRGADRDGDDASGSVDGDATSVLGDTATIHRLVAENNPDAVSVHDLAGRYLWASSAFADLLGMDPGELIGRQAYELFHPEDVPEIRESHQTVVEQETSHSVAYRIRQVDDTYRWVETTSRLVDGRIIVAATRSIEPRRSALRALEAERLLHERLLDVERQHYAFLTTVAHRLRHPVTTVLGFAQTLHEHRRSLSEDRVGDALERIVRNASEMRELIDEVTRAERLERRALLVDARVVPLADLVEDTVKTMAGADAPVRVEIPPSAVVFADRDLLEIALRIMLDNAIEHTPTGTEIWFRTEQDPEGAVVIVEDAGEGVPDHAREAIFEAFVRHDGDGTGHDPGMGLGLSTVAGIAAAHRGRAWVEERTGGGASFRILFPPARQPGGAAPARAMATTREGR